MPEENAFSRTDILNSLKKNLPAEMHDTLLKLTELLANAAEGLISIEELNESINNESKLARLVLRLSDAEPDLSNSLIAFGKGNQFRDVTIRDIAGRNINNMIVQVNLKHYNVLSLRAPVSDFVGQEERLEELTRKLELAIQHQGKLVIGMVSGMVGSGKTELALSVAHELKRHFPGGQLMINARIAGNIPKKPLYMLEEVIKCIDNSGGIAENFDIAQASAVFVSLLSQRKVLLLLDDVLDIEQIEALIPPVGSALIITSRERFALDARVEWIELSTFTPEEAETLLLSICGRIGSHANEVAALCGYLPLALRVAGALLLNDDTLRVYNYVQRLKEHRLQHLRVRNHPRLNVERSIRLSYDTLDPVLQDFFNQLCIFPSYFNEMTVSSIVKSKDERSVCELLSELRRYNLLGWDEASEQYTLHELLREFARSQMTSRQMIIVDKTRPQEEDAFNTHRTSDSLLQYLEDKVQAYGGESQAPVYLINSLRETRELVAQRLREKNDRETGNNDANPNGIFSPIESSHAENSDIFADSFTRHPKSLWGKVCLLAIHLVVINVVYMWGALYVELKKSYGLNIVALLSLVLVVFVTRILVLLPDNQLTLLINLFLGLIIMLAAVLIYWYYRRAFAELDGHNVDSIQAVHSSDSTPPEESIL